MGRSDVKGRRERQSPGTLTQDWLPCIRLIYVATVRRVVWSRVMGS